MAKLRKLQLIVAAVCAFAAANAGAATFKVIVNKSVHLDSISRKAASDLFLKRVATWEGGAPVVPVDNASTAVREEFSHDVHGKAAAAVKSYWNQQIFSGRAVPPVEKPSDAEVLAFVRSTAGAVGYVAESTPTDGVKVVAVQ